MSAIPAKVRALVLDRAGGRCEGCGGYAELELHHRQYRSRGGKHSAENIVALCGWGNHTGCHGIAHSGRRGTQLGWAVASWNDPAVVPVKFHQGWVVLRSDGSAHPMPEPFALELLALYGVEPSEYESGT